jgi:AcrR family transcriptional regulator
VGRRIKRAVESQMPVTRTPRTSWIEEGLRSLADGGPDAVRVEALAKRLGVSKGGFYWHFDDRRRLLDEILDEWERASIARAIAEVEGAGGDGRTRLRRLFALAGESDELLRADLAIRDWGRRDATVAARVRRVDNQRVLYMRSLFGEFCPDPEEVEARCLLVMSLWIGSHFVAADHDGQSRRAVMRWALTRLLE